MLISNSGETDKILELIPFLKAQKNKMISMSGNPNSTLTENTNFHLNIAVKKEACPLQLAPTSSTTATMVMGDAIAVTLMRLRSFIDVNFAKFHPGGSLGRRLLHTVESVMSFENLPIVEDWSSIKEVISAISVGKCGLVIVMKERQVKGVISDGDIRRAMENKESMFFQLKAKDIMTKKSQTISKK